MGAFKLGKMTFGSLFKKPETTKYPFEKKPQPAGLKGHIVVNVDECILCGMCERSCSTSCITVNKKERSWGINPYSCIQCGYCITMCPKSCLHMDPNYWAAATTKKSERFIVPGKEKAAPVAKAATTEPEAVGESKVETAKTAAPIASSAPNVPAVPTVANVPEAPTKQPQVAHGGNAEKTVPIAGGGEASQQGEGSAPSEIHDAQLTALISLLDPEKAKIVESALTGR